MLVHFFMSIMLSSCFFFFKQKTAYEMRISDWSSDVCSSDLPERQRLRKIATQLALLGLQGFMMQRAAGRIAIGHDQHRKALLVRLNPSRSATSRSLQRQIGRASCRERGCQYV